MRGPQKPKVDWTGPDLKETGGVLGPLFCLLFYRQSCHCFLRHFVFVSFDFQMFPSLVVLCMM